MFMRYPGDQPEPDDEWDADDGRYARGCLIVIGGALMFWLIVIWLILAKLHELSVI